MSAYIKRTPLEEYIDNKISMLMDEFYIRLNGHEIAHFYALKTESEVDHYALQLIIDKL